MFIGIFVKNFKCYQRVQFIPGYSSSDQPLVAYLGDNGVGKSAVLEALQAFFAKKPRWLRNKESKKGSAESFVAPVFWWPEENAPTIIKRISKELIKNLGIEFNLPGHLPVCLAKKENGDMLFFDGKKEYVDSISTDFFNQLTQVYKFVYIDAEVDIDEQAKINSEIYEMIIGSSISTEVENLFKESNPNNKLVEGLNETLRRLVDERFTQKLQQTDPAYSYGSTRGAISKLTINLLARVTTEAFLASRRLKYNSKLLEDLSSGQRRTALLDFIIAILDAKLFNGKKQLILAIDEPEISLDTGKKIRQFEKIIELADKGVQVMFTSHWYGWMVAANIGQSVLIEDGSNGERAFHKYSNSEFPFRDVSKYEMRMFFDFLTSLGASAEANSRTRYIICEGPSDRHFLEAHLGTDQYKVIPVGKKHVKKMGKIFSEYYWKEAGPKLKNVLFLIDTDPQNKDDYQNTYARRWSKNDDLTIALVAGKENEHNKCSIEDVLDPDILLTALQLCFPQSEFMRNLRVVHHTLSGVDAFGLDAVGVRSLDSEYKSSKRLVASKYEELLSVGTRKKTTSKLVQLIEEYFNE